MKWKTLGSIVLCIVLHTSGLHVSADSLLDSLLDRVENCTGEELAKTQLLIAQRIAATNPANAYSFAGQAMAYATKTRNSRLIAMSHTAFGIAHQSQGHSDSAVTSMNKALQIYEDLGDQERIAVILANLGGIYISMGNYNSSLKSYQKSMTIYRELKNDRGIGKCLAGMASASAALGDLTTSVEYYDQAIAIYKVIGETGLMYNACQNQAGVYSSMGLYDEALSKYQSAGELAQRAGISEEDQLVIQANIALAYSRRGDEHKADSLYQHILGSVPQPGRKTIRYANYLINAASVKVSLGDAVGALSLYDSAAVILKSTTHNKLRRALYTGYSNAYQLKGDYEKAVRFSFMLINLTDSLMQVENVAQANKLRIAYEVADKEKQIADQKIELQQSKNIQKVYIIIVLLSLTVLLVIFQRFRYRKRKNRELSALNAELRTSEESLRENIRMRDKLFAIIMHDLRSPLGNLQAVSEYIVDNVDAMQPEQMAQNVKMVHDSLDQVNLMIEDLAKWAALYRNPKGIHQREFALLPIMKKVEKLYRPVAQKKGIDLVNTGEDASITAFGNPAMIETVIRNLVDNAIKYTPSGGEVRMGLQTGDMIRVSIRDTGRGLEGIDRDRLFTYTESESQNLDSKGSGLGLMLCYDFVKSNGGDIEVESNGRSSGSTFSFTVPAQGTQE